MTNPWTQLVIAGLLEVAWALGMKQSLGFTRPGWSAFTIATMIASFYLLSRAMQALPVGTAYAVWTGIGAVGAAILGVVFLGDSSSPLRIGGIALILTGIVAIKLAG